MDPTAQPDLTTTQPVPSVEAQPHSAGGVGSILSTTPALRCTKPESVDVFAFYSPILSM
jgi:hypothetical protein